MRIALAQLLSGSDPDENLTLVRGAVSDAAAAGARLLVLPEATLRAFGAGPLAAVAEPLDGPWASAVREAVAEAERSSGAALTVVVGTFTPGAEGPEGTGGSGAKVRNTALVAGGGADAAYDKVHLFDAFTSRESATVEPGDRPLVVDVGGVGVGVATCYDVRFPGLFTAMADAGAQVVVLPASWGSGPGKAEQLRLLARARALDSTCVVAVCDQADPLSVEEADLPAGVTRRERPGAPTGVGGSLVVSALGEVLGELGAEPSLLVVDVDVDAVASARASLPVLVNRRF